MSHLPKFSIVVPVFNAIDFLPTCLEAILQAMGSYGNCELTIVDNGSTDGSYELLLEKYNGNARILQLPEVTISTLRNRGAALSEGEYLAFVDSDCIISANYFEVALNAFYDSGASALGADYSLPESPHWIEETWHGLHRSRGLGPVNYIPGGNFLVRKSTFLSIGGFKEDLETGEDAEICQRLIQAGHEVYNYPVVKAVHLGNPKSSSHFFRKQMWHGMGMFGTFRNSWFDKPVLLTFFHLFNIILAMNLVLFMAGSTAVRFFYFAALLLLAPLLAMVYRLFRLKRFYRLFWGTYLYLLYLTARVCALVRLIVGKK